MNPTIGDATRTLAPLATYAFPLALVWLVYARRRRSRERRARGALEAALAAGLTEPASLHPRIDPSRCLGCRTCVTACPEGDVLGVIGAKARLVNPSHCIGHGACQEACPQDAIELVLGTETRGVEIPVSSPEFETSVPGLFVAGEVAGMGLIRNAIEQGLQAVDAIARRGGGSSEAELDLVVVGAGPAGLAASLAAQERGLRYRTLEQESLGGTVAHYPRGKIVMTRPAHLPLVGRIDLRETTKESLLELWRDVERRTAVAIRYGERVERVEPLGRPGDGFRVTTSRGAHTARAVLLAIGRRGTPRRLGATGEDLPKVVYSLVDAEQYRGRRVLVVGGGDSALEAALQVAGQPGAEVSLSYRGRAFQRAKPANRQAVETLAARERLALLLESRVVEIGSDRATIETPSGTRVLANDDVIVCAGGILPSGFLRDAGIALETARGRRMR